MQHEKSLPKSNSPLDLLFHIRDTINQSEQPLTFTDIESITDIKIRTVQRYAMRLATERLVDFRVQPRDKNKIGRSGYEFARVGFWNNF